MATIRIKYFAGEVPKVHETLLGDTNAQTADDLNFNRGTIQAMDGRTTVQATTRAGTIQSIFKYSDTVWLEWTGDIDASKSPIANDSYDRVYFTGDGYPKHSYNSVITSGGAPYPAVDYRLGVPAPATPTANLTGTATDPTSTPETRFYVITYVDNLGSEGPPSLPSGEVEWRDGQTVDLTLPGAPTGAYAMTAGTAFKRVYRVNTGTTGSVYQYVADVALATTAYNDAVASANLGEALSTTTYDEPPDDTMAGLTLMPGEFFAAFFNNVLCFSEPGFPHAWPTEYQLTTDYPIVGIKAFGNSLLVATEGTPYIVTGVNPGSMSITKMEVAQSCVSKRGMVDMGQSVIYPSPDGLVSIGVTGGSIISEELFDRDAWQALVPTTINAYLWENKYLAFYNDGAATKAFSIDPLNIQQGVIFYDVYSQAAFNDLEADTLYLVSGSNIVTWGTNAAAPDTYTWKSKKFISPKAINFSAGQVLADGYTTLTLKYYADGVLQHTETVTDGEVFRLPSGFLASSHELTIEGTEQVYEVAIATSVEELRDV